MNFKWSQEGIRHFLFVPHPTDPDKVFDIAFMEADPEISENEYWYVVTGRIYNYAPDDDFQELGTFHSLEEAKKALEEEMHELFAEEFEYWKKIMGATENG